MKRLAWIGMFTVLAVGAWLQAQEMPPMPKPVAEHDWLKQLAGEWDVTSRVVMEEGQPPMEFKATESARMVGDFWLISESQGMMMEMPVTSILTLGYDLEKQKFVGTWLGSVSDFLWTYEGTLDASRKKLTLDTEGICPGTPGRRMKVKDTIEIQDENRRTLTSTVQNEDGSWSTMVTMEYTRK